MCLDDVSVHATKRQAPNYGSRVPVDTTPGPAPWWWWWWWFRRCDNSDVFVDTTACVHLIRVAEHPPPGTHVQLDGVRKMPQLRNGNVLKRCDELNLRHFHCARDPNLSLRDHSDVQRFSQRPGTVGVRLFHPQPARHIQTVYTGWTTAPVVVTITSSKNCTCGGSTGSSTV